MYNYFVYYYKKGSDWGFANFIPTDPKGSTISEKTLLDWTNTIQEAHEYDEIQIINIIRIEGIEYNEKI